MLDSFTVGNTRFSSRLLVGTGKYASYNILYTFTIGNIGVGLIFSTQTKPNANPVGISYVYWAKQFSKFPIVAIGGIKTINADIV